MRSTLFTLAICMCANGCGTFSDAMCGPITDHVYYRGVRFDIGAVKEGGALTLLAADIPFSAVADTVLASYIAYHKMMDPPARPPAKAATETAVAPAVDSTYAANFQKIGNGMTEGQVSEILGRRWDNAVCCGSLGPRTCYWNWADETISVTFECDGRVIGKDIASRP